MSRKTDLEQSIRECYDIIRDYEKIVETTDRPEERARARREMQERWELIEAYLDEYHGIAEGEWPQDIVEIAARFSPEAASALPEPIAGPALVKSGSQVEQWTKRKVAPWRWVLRIIAISVVIASIVWLIVQPGFEPLIGFLSAFGALIASLVGEERGADETSQSIGSDAAPHTLEEPAVIRPRIVNLRPLDMTHSFKDREREIEALLKHLSADGVRLISIVGRGGMGKTALACRVLADLEQGVLCVPGEDRELTIDGILYLSARSTGLSLDRIYTDAGRMLDEPITQRLKARWAGEDTPIAAKVEYLLEAMQAGLYLILLDNLEDYLTKENTLDEEGLRLFIERCLVQPTGARLIVTSREQVNVVGAGLHNVRCIPLLEGLPEQESVALLRALDPQTMIGLRDATEADLQRAAQSTSGIPRAIEIVAGILHRDRTVTLRELLDNKALFGAQVVERLVAEGYQRLGADERRVMEALAVFDTPVNEEAIAHLLMPWFPDLEVRNNLRDLVSGHFLRLSRATRQYSLHPLDREYSYLQLPHGEVDGSYSQRNLELRAADYYASIRKPGSECKSIDDLAPQLAEFEHRVRAGDYDRACKVLETIDYDYLHRWGHFARLVDMSLQLPEEQMSPDCQGINAGRLGLAYQYLGESERAIGFYQKALSVARELGDRRIETIYLSRLGLVYRAQGSIEQGRRYLEESLAIARDIVDRRSEGFCLGVLGGVYQHLGQFDRAIVHIQEALTIARKIDYTREVINRLGNLGGIYRNLGQFDEALQAQDEALALARQTGDRREEASLLRSKGNVAKDRGQLVQAVELYTQALAIAREIGALLGEEILLSRMGDVSFSLGRMEQSLAFHKDALALAQETGNHIGTSYDLLGLGRVCLAIGEICQAEHYCVAAREIDVPDNRYQAALTLGIARLYKSSLAAADAFQDAIACCRDLLGKTARLAKPRYSLATSLLGQAACNPQWPEGTVRRELLTQALAEYRRALDNCSAKGVVQDAIRDLELIRAAGIEGLEPVFELLESAIEDKAD